MIRAVVLVGGPTKTGSFGPFECTPPVAGKHLVEHIIDNLNVKEVICYGFYE